MPTIHEHYAINIEQARKEAHDTNKVVLADARFDVQSIVHIPCKRQLQKYCCLCHSSKR